MLLPFLLPLSAVSCLLAPSIAAQTTTVTYTIPSVLPTVNISTHLDPNPIGISFEFFAWPAYWATVRGTVRCLRNLADVMGGVMPPIRIGGTTQDRATYDPGLMTPVNYTIATPGGAPASLTYGPSFMDMAAEYPGNVTLGLNRQLNNIPNTHLSATYARTHMHNLLALELGNEPEFYALSSPIVPPPRNKWNFTLDAQSQLAWQKALGFLSLIQAGVYLQPPTWSTAKLAPLEVAAGATKYLKSFAGHSYPQTACGGAATNLRLLMDHKTIVNYTTRYRPEVAAAKAAGGKPYYLAETNSATCGGGGISPTFGAALWIVDYSLQALVQGVRRLYYHHGTIGNCAYCWWGASTTAAPYYGAYFLALALEGGDRVASLDDGEGVQGVYVVYKVGKAVRVVLTNSEFYGGVGVRGVTRFVLQGLGVGRVVSVRRLTGEAAGSLYGVRAAGLAFGNGTCVAEGEEVVETVVGGKDGSVVVEVEASAAAVVGLVV